MTLAARVTKQFIEVLSVTAPAARATKQFVEVLSVTAPAARATKQFVEVLTTVRDKAFLYAYPAADGVAGEWLPSVGGTLYGVLNEDAASPVDDGYVWTGAAGSWFAVQFGDMSADDGSDSERKWAVRGAKSGAYSTLETVVFQYTADSPTAEVTIASRTQALTTTLTTYEFILTAGESALINHSAPLFVKARLTA